MQSRESRLTERFTAYSKRNECIFFLHIISTVFRLIDSFLRSSSKIYIGGGVITGGLHKLLERCLPILVQSGNSKMNFMRLVLIKFVSFPIRLSSILFSTHFRTIFIKNQLSHEDNSFFSKYVSALDRVSEKQYAFAHRRAEKNDRNRDNYSSFTERGRK